VFYRTKKASNFSSGQAEDKFDKASEKLLPVNRRGFAKNSKILMKDLFFQKVLKLFFWTLRMQF